MIGVDTNVLVRFAINDEAENRAKVVDFFAKRTADDPAFVSVVVLIEFVWVLRSRYRFTQAQVAFAILSLMSSPALVFEEHHLVAMLMRGANVKPGDLADHLAAFCAQRAGCSRTVTLDAAAASAINSMELLA